MPVSTASASGCPRCAGTRSLSVVGRPRPSPARSASPSARTPSHAPPGAKSPESSARAGKRTALPSGPTAAQFIPVPQTTPMPHDDVVPALETANVSLRRITWSVHPSAPMASASFSSSTGRSMPARQ